MKARKIGRLLSALLTLAMLLTLLPMSAFAATSGAEITVYKTDRDGNPLEGAHFTLVQQDAAETPVPFDAYSDEQGKAVFSGVPEGYYTLSEEHAPNGYLKSDKTYTLYVVNDGGESNSEFHVYWNFTGETSDLEPYSPVTFVNDPVAFTVNKVDDRGAPVAGAAFALYVRDRDGAGWMPEPSYEAKSNASGAAVFSAVANGYYLLKETSAPDGYTKSDDSYEIYVNNDRPDPVWLYKEVGSNGEPYAPVTFVNQRVFGIEDIPDPIRITVNKVDEKGDPLQGATFALYEKTYASDGEEIVAPEPAYEAVSGKRGTAVFRNVADGFYILKEVSAPDGYVKSDDSYEVYVDESRRDPVWLYKEPGSNGEPYAPVTFVNTSEAAAPGSQPAEPSAPGSEPAGPSAPGSEPAGPTEPTVPTEPGPDDTDVPIANPPKTGNGVLASGAALTGLLCCAAAVVLYGKKKK